MIFQNIFGSERFWAAYANKGFGIFQGGLGTSFGMLNTSFKPFYRLFALSTRKRTVQRPIDFKVIQSREKVVVKGLLFDFSFQKFVNVIEITSALASSLTTFQTFVFRTVGGSIRSRVTSIVSIITKFMIVR